LHYVAEADIAEGGCCYWAYGDYRGFAGQVGNGAEDLAAFAFVPIEKIADGGGAEEENGFQVSGGKLILSFAFGLGGKCTIGDDFGYLRAETAESVGEIGTGEVAAREKDALASKFRGKFLCQSHALMLCGNVTYMQARRASHFGGDRPHSGNANGSEGIHNVHGKGSRALQQGANGICAGEQKPVKRAQITKGLIQRSEIAWRMESDHWLEHGLCATSFERAD
jgi:hypothetical protein